MSTEKLAQATIAMGDIEYTILENYLLKTLPKDNFFTFEYFKNITSLDFSRFWRYLKSDLFTIKKKKIIITENKQILNEHAKKYCKNLILKNIHPSKFRKDETMYLCSFFFGNFYTDEENKFIDLLFDKFMEIFDFEIFSTPKNEILNFFTLNEHFFYQISFDIFNAILHKEIHIGDSILPYVTEFPNKTHFSLILEQSSKYDYYFDNKGILKCDLETNVNTLIKNILNTLVYKFYNFESKILFLSKMSSRYSFLIENKDGKNE